MRILLAEYDLIQADAIRELLRTYQVDVVHNGEQAWQAHVVNKYDLLVIDVSLPELTGIDFCVRLRKSRDYTPVLLLTANTSIEMRIQGLNAGADDYLYKPVLHDEFAARIRNLIWRGTENTEDFVEIGDLKLDYRKRIAYLKQTEIRLTPKEYEILELLVRQPNQIFSRTHIVQRLWPFDSDTLEESVKTHIKSIRLKFRDAGQHNIIRNIRGVGYRLSQDLTSHSPSASFSNENDSSFAELWKTFQPLMQQRLMHIRSYLQSLDENTATKQQKETAIHSAHNLAGSIGLFMPGGLSDIARSIEIDFMGPQIKTNRHNMENKINMLADAIARESVNGDKLPSIEKDLNQRQSAIILVVDDDPIFLDMARQQLEQYRLKIETCSDPNLVTEKLHFINPDLLLLDIDLGTANGIEICSTLRNNKRWQGLPIVFVTAHQEPEVISAIFRALGDDYISKPLIAEEFGTRIIKRLGRLKFV